MEELRRRQSGRDWWRLRRHRSRLGLVQTALGSELPRSARSWAPLPADQGSRWQASPGHPLSSALQPASKVSSPPTASSMPTASSNSSSRETGGRMRIAWWCAARATPSWSAWAEEAPPRCTR
ncbi:hypothetical protein CVIRNUC_007904 [Coccomyxa viridis]|uniref:Uncharacterized protein n=1 Tax=Coccomyxa viridis TaxID=1274662 RepID=A0AAV1IFG1_9CHLO|nr:hypothetical protein CVIRNUC_007904 [Coccomyxa viridis]